MYSKNKIGIPIIDFTKISITEFIRIFGYNDHNIICHNIIECNNKIRMVNSTTIGIYIIIKNNNG